MQNTSDESLIKELKTENNAAFELLYKFHFPSVANYIKQNTGNLEDAEDIFQEVIVVLLQKIRNPTFILTASLKTYLLAIAKNLWLKRLRDNKLIVGEEINSFSNFPDEDGIFTFELLPEKSKQQQVQTWLEKITENCKQVLKAIFIFKEPMDSLMVKMGWKNKHTAANQKYKCMEQIKKEKEKGTRA